MDRGRINADGTVYLHGFEPEKRILVGINTYMLAYKTAGSVYWTNGGKNYGPANITVGLIKSLRPGNEPGTYEFELLQGPGTGINFHPTPATAHKEAMESLRKFGEKNASPEANKRRSKLWGKL